MSPEATYELEEINRIILENLGYDNTHTLRMVQSLIKNNPHNFKHGKEILEHFMGKE